MVETLYCSQMSVSSFISCSLLCSSLVSEEPCICGDLAQNNKAAALGVWSDVFETPASSSPCLSVTGRWEWAEGESWFWGTVFTQLSIFSLQSTFENRNAKQRSFRNLEKSKHRQEARLKSACGPKRSRTGWRWAQVAECLQPVLINAVCEAGQFGDGSSRAASWSAAKMLWKHCFSLSLMTCQDHKRSSGSAGPGAQVLWGQSWRAVRPLFLPKGWQTAAEHQGGFLSFRSLLHP